MAEQIEHVVLYRMADEMNKIVERASFQYLLSTMEDWINRNEVKAPHRDKIIKNNGAENISEFTKQGFKVYCICLDNKKKIK